MTKPSLPDPLDADGLQRLFMQAVEYNPDDAIFALVECVRTLSEIIIMGALHTQPPAPEEGNPTP